MKYFIYLFITSIICTNASASTIYNYTGNTYSQHYGHYQSDMYINGYLTLENSLASNLVNAEVSPSEFSFSDGVLNINSNMSSLGTNTFTFSTNSSGEVIDWSFYMMNYPSPMTSIGDYSHGIESFGLSNYDAAWVYECKTNGINGNRCQEAYDISDVGRAYNAGTWSAQVVPIPLPIWLFMSGLITLAAIGKRRN